MPSKTILSLSFIFCLFFLTIIFPSVFIDQRPGPSLNPSTSYQPLTVNQPASLNLNFPVSGFNSISFYLKNPAIQNHSQITISIKQGDQILRQQAFSGQNVGDPSWLTYKFNPLQSGNYIIELTTDNSQNSSLYFYSNASQPSFQTTYQPTSLSSSLSQIIQSRLTQLHQRLFWPQLIYLAIILGLLFIY